MNKFSTLLWILLSVGVVLSVNGQQLDEPCGTMGMDALLRQKYPSMGTLDDFERLLQLRIAERKELERRGRITNEVITIPVVVHIVHNGEAVGQGRNLSLARINAQLETLNEDFRRKPGTPGFNNDPRGADIEIEFCAARLDPQGRTMPEPGVNRINGLRTNWSRNDIENVLKPSSIWDPDRYFNIWVVDFASTDANLLGYAQFPSLSTLPGIPANSPRNTDGVVVRFQSFGNVLKGNFANMQAPYNRGRTLTHEVGHWLGLRHIWGDAACGNDFCDDTPTQASESRGCQEGRVSCGGNVNMVQNYMDYSDDACMNIFTRDQKTRMRTVMEISPRRNTLITSNLCGTLIAGPPVPNFLADSREILLGAQVRFNDLSSNFPNRWFWTFEGGTPQTSTEQNPVVTYSQPGKFRVTLVAANGSGTSDTLRRNGFIEVLNVGLCAEKTNFTGAPVTIRDPSGRGVVSGHNGRQTRAISEFFTNPLGYTTMSGASIRFAKAFAKEGRETEAVVNITVWNARGFQGGPGAVLEVKEMPLRRILEDVAANRPTKFTFDRPVPLFGLPYHVGVQLVYNGDSIAVATNRDGEAVQGTSWEQDANGDWDLYLRANGLNVAHDISVNVGMNPSVLISASAQFINPGERVTLQARGASIYTWSPSEGLNTTLGPQVIARPTRTATYAVKGTGAEVCNDSSSTTIYVRNVQILGVESSTLPQAEVVLSPNPTADFVLINLHSDYKGEGTVRLYSLTGVPLSTQTFQKTAEQHAQPLSLQDLPSGLYLVEIRLGEAYHRSRVLKY